MLMTMLSPARQKVISRVLGILQEKVFTVMCIYYGVSVYQNAPKQEEWYKEQAVILLCFNVSYISILWGKLLKIEAYDLLAGKNFDTLM